MLEKSAILCPKCGTVVFSRATHDYNSCTCGDIAIDGGFDYCKIAFKTQNYIFLTLILPKSMTKKVLYDDWNSRKDKHGTYKVGSWPIFVQKAIVKQYSEKK